MDRIDDTNLDFIIKVQRKKISFEDFVEKAKRKWYAGDHKTIKHAEKKITNADKKGGPD